MLVVVNITIRRLWQDLSGLRHLAGDHRVLLSRARQRDRCDGLVRSLVFTVDTSVGRSRSRQGDCRDGTVLGTDAEQFVVRVIDWI